jgi:hypothetical protein
MKQQAFTADLYDTRLAEGIPEEDVKEDIARMPIPEYLNCVAVWVAKHERRTLNPNG